MRKKLSILTQDEGIKSTVELNFDILNKRDGLVLAGILVGISIPVILVNLLANGIIDNPIP